MTLIASGSEAKGSGCAREEMPCMREATQPRKKIPVADTNAYLFKRKFGGQKNIK